VLVAVPARDEAASIASCLRHVLAAGQLARQAGSVGRFRIAVAAHRCTDQTAATARAILRGAGVDHLVLHTDELGAVGRIRTRLIETAMAAWPVVDPSRTWVLSTVADSLVPGDWIDQLMIIAGRTGADLVAGMTELSGWPATERARDAYAAIIQAGMTPGGHRHVYAANLAVRYRTFTAVGGFPDVPHGEERELLAAVQRAGGLVVSTLQPTGLTSGRMPGRAAQGPGVLLAQLVADTEQAPEGAA